MSHDADKLIRQLSLVAFLMAERRLLTARDVKSNVEGYSEMSDEAFARRFYSDRAELTALGVPLQSQRDEFTGEELYTLRSEHYFLDRLDLDDDELAALQTALYYLEGKFAYAEPLAPRAPEPRARTRRVPGAPDGDGRARSRQRTRLLAGARRPPLEARVGDLEAAHGSVRLLEPAPRRPGERTVNPYALRLDDGNWYVVGHDLEREHDADVQGLAHPRRHPLRDEARARLPDSRGLRRRAAPDPRPWQIGEIVGRARIAVSGDTAWWVERTLSDAGTVEDGVFETDYASVELLAGWVLRQNGRAVPLEPDELVEAVSGGARAHSQSRTTARRPAAAGPKRSDPRQPLPERPVGPVAPERFGVLQALLAHLLTACGDERSATLDAAELAARFSIPLEELQDHLSLLNLVNFGGGCYAVYAEHDGDVVTGREGALRRRLPPITEAHAARGARDPAGDRVRRARPSPRTRTRPSSACARSSRRRSAASISPAPRSRSDASAEESLVKVLSDGAEKRIVVEIEYLKEGDDGPSLRQVEPYMIERELPVWRVHTWDLTVDGARTFRLDRMRSARLTGDRFEARDGFDPSYLRNPRVARLLHSPAVARWKLERGARALTDGSAVADVPFKTEDWLLSEVLADRGETIVLEPQRLRDVVAKRARRLQRELGRVPSRR